MAALAAIFVGAPAHAQPVSDSGESKSEARKGDPTQRLFALDGSVTAGWQHTKEYGSSVPAYLGATFLYRPSSWMFGLTGQLGGAAFEEPQVFAGVLGGVGLEATPWLRVDVLGEFGAHIEDVTGRQSIIFETKVTGGETVGVVPYAGLRVSPVFTIGKENSFIVGPWLQFRQDLVYSKLDYQVYDCFLFCSESTQSTTIGGTLLAAGLRVGGQFGHQ